MSATTLTQTTIKTQWVSSCHHQPLLVSSPCIIPSPPADLTRKPTPLRCSARLIRANSPRTPTRSPRSKRRRPSTPKHNSSPLPAPTPSHPERAQRAPPPVSSPAQFPSLQPLQAIAQNDQPRLSLSLPHHPSPVPLSFPATPIPAHFVFHFPIPTPARHLPPPHPAQRHSISLPAHLKPHHEHHRLASANHLQPFPTWLITPQSHRPQRKRPLALPHTHHIRAKKIKLDHPFFRSPQVLYPVDYSISTPTSFGNLSAMSSRSKAMENPKWLHTSAAAHQGQSSKMRPREAQYTGKPENWSPQSNCTLSLSPRPPWSASTVPKLAPLAKPHCGVPLAASAAGPQVAPLKAQLLAVLRMHSNHQPGEAALRLKKWVIWNSWVRSGGPMRYYPIANSSPPNNTRVIARSSSPPASTPASDGQDPSEDDEAQKPATRAEACPSAHHAGAPRKARSPPKTRTAIKLRIPQRSPTAPHPAPPLSPVSPSQPPSVQTNTGPLSTATHNPLTPPPSPPDHHPHC